jgi:transposase
VAEPGLWIQWDWGEGARVDGRRTNLWCAWLAWSRFRVVIAVWDRTLPTIVACLDTTLRWLGGVPTYALTDNERTVSVDHVAGIAVRHPEIVEVGRHYGTTIRTCVPTDPQSKGGSEATVRIAKADLVPTQVNLGEEYRTFGFDEIMPKTLATATVDRLLHHAHIVVTDGDSYRLAQATAGKGVTPLT